MSEVVSGLSVEAVGLCRTIYASVLMGSGAVYINEDWICELCELREAGLIEPGFGIPPEGVEARVLKVDLSERGRSLGRSYYLSYAGKA